MAAQINDIACWINSPHMQTFQSGSKHSTVFFGRFSTQEDDFDFCLPFSFFTGALNKAITESKLDKDNSVFTKLADLHSKIVDIAERGFNQIKSSDSDYFHKFKHLIDAKWFAMMPYHSVDKSLFHQVTLHDDDSFDEQSSDQCMTDLLGSQLEGVQQKCIVTDKCWNLMTKKGPDGYFLTHQGLFLLLAENRGTVGFTFIAQFYVCESIIRNWNQSPVMIYTLQYHFLEASC